MSKALLDFLTPEIVVVITAMLPVVELRGAIPLGISLGLSPLESAVLGYIGSLIPSPFILFVTRPLFNYLKGTRPFKKIVQKLTDRSVNISGAKIKKYGALGLLIFAAIPLPGTGVWSGSLAAALLDMRFKSAFLSIFIGNAIAAAVLYLLSTGVVSIIN